MDGLEDFRDLQGNNVNDFVKAYRDSLKQDYDTEVARLQKQRSNDYTSIMSQANKRGMMYSNFPERSKMQYDTNTYLPNVQNAYKTYQTGLDKLRSDALGSYNAVKLLQEQIKHMTEMGDLASSMDSSDLKWGALGTGDKEGWFYGNLNDKNTRDAVKFSTFARHNGYNDTTEGYLEAAKRWLNESQYNQLKTIVERQKETKTPNLIYNAGGFGNTPVDYDWGNRFSQEDANFLRSLGLAFG